MNKKITFIDFDKIKNLENVTQEDIEKALFSKEYTPEERIKGRERFLKIMDMSDEQREAYNKVADNYYGKTSFTKEASDKEIQEELANISKSIYEDYTK